MSDESKENTFYIKELQEKLKRIILDKGVYYNLNSIVQHHNELRGALKILGTQNLDMMEELAELKKKFEAFKEGEEDDIKEIGILREELAELKESLNEVAQSRIGWEENIENNYRELLKKYSECEDSTIHKKFFLRLLEKLDVGSARQTVKQCVNCRKYKTEDCPPWPTKGPDHWCTQFETIKSGGDSK